MDAIFKNQYDVITLADRLIHIKFGKPVQNHMPMMVNRSKSKPEIEFQYGERLFFKSGSSIISAIH